MLSVVVGVLAISPIEHEERWGDAQFTTSEFERPGE